MTEFTEQNNPFTPLFGKIPPVLAGRTQLINTLTEALESGGVSPELSTIITGVRGSGKTALLRYIGSKAEELGWVVASVTAKKGMLDDILQRSYSATKHLSEIATGNKKKLTQLQVSGIGVSWENKPELELNFRSKITQLLESLSETNTGLLFIVDEINGKLTEMIELACVFQHLIGENRKVALFMAGLPYNVSTLLLGKTTSFMCRSQQFKLGSLSDYDIKEAFNLTVEQGNKTINEDALNLAVEKIAGFPFMMQLVGYRCWNASGKSKVINLEHVEMGSEIAEDELKAKILGSTIAELSKGDLEFLSAMNKNEETTSRKYIAKQTNRTQSWISKYKKRLLTSGVIEETLLGDLKFALPGLAEYLTENGL